MADNENTRKPAHPRRNPPYRPPPGVQKAIQNFGVRDLREYLDKKHQDLDQGESQDDKKLQQKKLPPADPTFNYLRDPARDRPKPPPPKQEESKKPRERHPKYREPPRYNREKNELPEYTPQYRNREQENNNPSLKPSSESFLSAREEDATKKELNFSEAPEVIDGEPRGEQILRGGRSSFRGRNPRRGHGSKPKDNREEKIENPFNIKIQLTTETGQRSCTLDESTKIADIKHVPDQALFHRSSRGFSRGGRGNFRARGRGRNSSRGRGGISTRGSNKAEEPDSVSPNYDDEGDTSPKTEVELKNSENQISVNCNDNDDEQENNENDEFVDSNENYDEDNSTDQAQSSEGGLPSGEISPENERLEEKAISSFNANLAQAITVTSSKYEDGEAKRSVEVKMSNSELNNGSGKE